MNSFRRPLGLILPGGGALCAWQAGALETLVLAGLKFDHVVGVSGGALNAGAYYAGLLPEEMHHWRDADGIRALALAPRLRPLSLCDIRSVWNLVDYALDDEKMRRQGICDLTVLNFRDEDSRTVYARFTPRGERGWDGPLADRLVASAAIPFIYPPVSIGGKLYRDGGTRGVEPAHFDALAQCRDIVVIHPIRPDERGRRPWGPWARREQAIRERSLAEVEEGLDCLRGRPEPPRVLSLYPSQILDFSMLGFTTRNCRPAVDLGVKDGSAYLASQGAIELAR
jgi:predicted acylesterase/phospholipase RssA